MTGVSGTTKRTFTGEQRHDGSVLTDDFQEVSAFAQNSIEITQGQNGKIGWSVKMYCVPGDELATLNEAKALTDKIKALYGGE